MKGYEVGDSLHSDRIRAEARKISDTIVIAKTGRHKAQRIVLTEDACAIVEKRLRWVPVKV